MIWGGEKKGRENKFVKTQAGEKELRVRTSVLTRTYKVLAEV
jgi:hypothetical protein